MFLEASGIQQHVHICHVCFSHFAHIQEEPPVYWITRNVSRAAQHEMCSLTAATRLRGLRAAVGAWVFNGGSIPLIVRGVEFALKSKQ